MKTFSIVILENTGNTKNNKHAQTRHLLISYLTIVYEVPPGYQGLCLVLDKPLLTR